MDNVKVEEEPKPIRDFLGDEFKDKIENLNSYTKETITIDYDNIELKVLRHYILRCFAMFCSNEKEVRDIFKNKSEMKINLVRSSTKKNGYHLTITYPNNYLENIYVRRMLGDDIARILKDIERLSTPYNIDRVFNSKTTYNIKSRKRFYDSKRKKEKVDILNTTGLKIKTIVKFVVRENENYRLGLVNNINLHLKREF